MTDTDLGPLIDRSYLTEELNETPRQKCCEQCAFLRSDPQQIQCNPEWEHWDFDWQMGLAKFYCVHSTDEQGRNQVCAGYHAIYGRHLT